MKKSAIVYYNDKPAGILTKESGTYRFIYDEAYLNGANNRPISITIPLQKEAYESNRLFPVFINMVSEGANKRIQCRMLKIDENDYFSLLLATTKEDSIGPLTLKLIDEPA
ncbi:MAG TPA: HipA N-terminal domain-containing protein [Chitinophagaceae bacterium]|nr:HipA N-terminal domain-containing protein [Chitinophagaceae bacterium]